MAIALPDETGGHAPQFDPTPAHVRVLLRQILLMTERAHRAQAQLEALRTACRN